MVNIYGIFIILILMIPPPHPSGASDVKNPPSMWEIWVPSLGCTDPLEKGIPTPSSIPALIIPWTEEPGGLPSMRQQRIGHDWVAFTHIDRFLNYAHPIKATTLPYWFIIDSIFLKLIDKIIKNESKVIKRVLLAQWRMW